VRDSIQAANFKRRKTVPTLDGTEAIKPTPFDAHDKVVRDSSGYEHQEYPKAVAHNEGKTEPVIATDPNHEAELAEKEEQ
jgi:hypothetical protein